MRKPELLAPAGGPEALRTAVLYGADAVYLGGSRYGLRAKARNFDREQMRENIAYAHQHGVRVHVAVNILAHNEHLEGLEAYLKEQGLSVYKVFVGDYVTSLDMNGAALNVMKLDDELKELLDYEAKSPGIEV